MLFPQQCRKEVVKNASGVPFQGMVGCAGLAMKMVSIKKEKVCVSCVKLENVRRLEVDVIFVFNE